MMTVRYMSKIFEGGKNEFTRQYKLANPEFSTLMTVREEHLAKYRQSNYGMTDENIQNVEGTLREQYGQERAITAEEAWNFIDSTLWEEMTPLLEGEDGEPGLRARAEAAWRVYQVRR